MVNVTIYSIHGSYGFRFAYSAVSWWNMGIDQAIPLSCCKMGWTPFESWPGRPRKKLDPLPKKTMLCDDWGIGESAVVIWTCWWPHFAWFQYIDTPWMAESNVSEANIPASNMWIEMCVCYPPALTLFWGCCFFMFLCFFWGYCQSAPVQRQKLIAPMITHDYIFSYQPFFPYVFLRKEHSRLLY